MHRRAQLDEGRRRLRPEQTGHAVGPGGQTVIQLDASAAFKETHEQMALTVARVLEILAQAEHRCFALLDHFQKIKR